MFLIKSGGTSRFNERGAVSRCDLVAEREGEMGEWLKPTVC